ncbi:hypothetical protein [Tissierella pigra]|uniref:Uncharacterized protein n=1 Tax=Tissierella pigra TaxID=2607614 RepID=A0A6N7XUE3_9FIRM|nr:hypothetical protein [Tissierella pigra]MSU01397.1 hypothetical protein [Tissierella pigra]
MENTFKEDFEIVKNKNISKLIKLDKMLKKINNTVCRGEVNIIDKDRNLLAQTHYEYFKIAILEDMVLLTRYNNEIEIETKDTTRIHTNNITRYRIDTTSLTLEGDLNDNTIVNILIVVKDLD